MKAFLVALCLVLAGPAARAATVTVAGMNGAGAAVVKVAGQIVPGDDKRFLAATAAYRDAVVVLDSRDGSARDAVAIGATIRSRGFRTIVQPGVVCASACAIIWLTGRQRLMPDGAKIGFHAAYSGDTKAVSGSGNALIGAYLSSLGLSFDAIVFMTSAGPRDVAWLTRKKAEELGVVVAPSPPGVTDIAGPPRPGASLDVAATLESIAPACDEETIVDIYKAALLGKERFQRFLADNRESLDKRCVVLREKSTVVIRKASVDQPVLCVDSEPDRFCTWTLGQALRGNPDLPAWPAAKPLSERTAFDICKMALAPNGRGWNTSSWSAVQEADRRGLKLETCLAIVSPVASRPAPPPPPLPQLPSTQSVPVLSADQVADCRVAAAPGGWIAGEAANRLKAAAVTFDTCRYALLLPPALAAIRAEEPVDVAPTNRDKATLCFLALTLDGSDFEKRGIFVREIVRRGLLVPACHAILVCRQADLSAGPRQADDMACASDLENEPPARICRAALSEDRRSWSNDPVYGFAVAEVRRRGLVRAECLQLAGKGPVATAPAPSGSAEAPR